MGYEPIDAWYEEQQQAVYDGVLEAYRNSDEYAEDKWRAIEEFISERQKSYYLSNPLVAEPAFNLLEEARELYKLGHYPSAQVFAGAATEVGFGDILLKPIVHGFVHSDTFAPMIADIIEGARAVYKFKALIVHIVSEFSGIDLYTFKVGGSTDSLWKDIDAVRVQRNNVLHKGNLAVTKEEAEHAILVAAALLEMIYPSVMKSLGLHLHNGIRVCGDPSC
jgi:hypothetical protein